MSYILIKAYIQLNKCQIQNKAMINEINIPKPSEISHNQSIESNKLNFQNILNFIRSKIQSQLKLKKLIQKAQKMDFMKNIPPQNQLNIKHTFYINIFMATNSVFFGIYMFTHQYYRRLKYVGLYLLGITYIGVSFTIFWEDKIFINTLSTKQDAYKSEIKYLLRKRCLQNIHLQRLQNKKSLFQALNQQFQQFHTINQGNRILNLLH